MNDPGDEQEHVDKRERIDLLIIRLLEGTGITLEK